MTTSQPRKMNAFLWVSKKIDCGKELKINQKLSSSQKKLNEWLK